MRRPGNREGLALTLALGLLAPSGAPLAQDRPAQPGVRSAFVRVAPRIPGVLYTPAAPGPKTHVALVVMHDNGDSLDHLAGPNLARRGFTVLTANTRYAPDSDDHDTDWDLALQDLGSAVKYLRAQPGIDRVILLGHSSGASLAAAYQNIAENGAKKACQGPEKIVACPSSLDGQAKADAVVLLDPIFGVGANVLTSVDPALEDPALDMYAAKNGFTGTEGRYSEAFRKRFLKAQAARNAKLIAQALARKRAVAAGQSAYADDEPFIAPGVTRTPRLWRPDLAMLSHTKGSYLLLKGDGTTATQVIRTVRPPSGLTTAVPARNDRGAGAPAQGGKPSAGGPPKPLLNGGSLETSVNRFLSTFASRSTADYDITEDSVTGIDWNSSYSSTPGNLEGVTAPFLVIGMTGHYWLVSSELAYQHVASKDKSIAFTEGATHGITPCQPCAKTPGQFGDTVGRTFDYVANWVGARF
jgi:acetyl esterase/lipase